MNEMGLRARSGVHQLFRDQSLLIVTSDGEVPGEGLDGFYYANTRLLSRFALRVNGEAPYPVQVHPARDDLLLAYYQDPRITGDPTLQDRALLVTLTVTAGSGFHIDLDARNHSLGPLDFELSLLLGADFADLEEARTGQDVSKIGNGRQQQAAVRRSLVMAGNEEQAAHNGVRELRFDYLHPRLQEAAILRFTTPPRCREDGVVWSLSLAPQQGWHTCIEVAPVHQSEMAAPVARCYGAFAGEAAAPPDWLSAATRVETSNDSVRRSYERAVSGCGGFL